MDSHSDCYIELSKHIFAPGDYLTGFVHLVLERPLNVDRVSVRFFGKLETFAQTEDGKKYHAGKTFFDRTFEILKFEKPTENGNQRSIRKELEEEDIDWAFKDVVIYRDKKEAEVFSHGFQAGSHKIPISYRLPSEDLVTSFAAKKCPTTVKYTVTGYFHFEDRLIRVARLNFPIVAPLPIYPEPQLPVENKVTGRPGKNSRGSVELMMAMNKISYLPTEKINCKISIRNNWKHSIKFVHFNILQKMISTAQNPSTVECKKVVSSVEHPGVGISRGFKKIVAGETFSFSPEYYIPALIPIKETPNLFKVEYFAKVQVGKAPNWIIAECLIPINIGTHYFNQEETSMVREEVLVDLSTPPQTPPSNGITFSPNNPFLRELSVNNYTY
ncbi:hypothetical protein FO519_003934 [Halicephalobus sp. NKZ332]|nr:hypothetical protein FO519_003934 [Halicephalobus sp. NKZ332]